MTMCNGELSGRTYRGALHVHTTLSDGKLSPEECCQCYRNQGYDFVFVTDHDLWNDHSHLSVSGLEVFSALELSCRADREHVLALGVHEPPRSKDTQEAIDWVNGLGGVPVLCHPFWSRMPLRRALELKDYPLMEVWNTHGGMKFARETTHFWDLLLEEGRRVYGVATDDCHAAVSCGGGFVEVWVDELSEGAILKTLREGRFYSSSGPKVEAVRWTAESIFVRAQAPVRGFALLGDGGYLTHQESASKSNPAPVEYEQQIGSEVRTYARVEVEDLSQRRAWLQPVWR